MERTALPSGKFLEVHVDIGFDAPVHRAPSRKSAACDVEHLADVIEPVGYAGRRKPGAGRIVADRRSDGGIGLRTTRLFGSGAGQFFNGTFGWPGIVAADIPQGGPAYPLATPGISVKYAPNETLTVRAAVYNGSPADPDADDPQRADRHGLEFRIEDPPLIMVEGEVNYSAWLPGVLKVGGWKHVGDFTDLRTGDVVHGSHGLYAVVDQQIWKGAGDAAVNAFGRVSASPDKQNLIDVYFDAGLVFSSLIASRPKDSFGAAFGYGRIGDRSRAADVDAALPVVRDLEAVLEINYSAEVIPGWVVIPDFQYIWHPGGGVEDPDKPGLAVEDAAVFGVRTTVNY